MRKLWFVFGMALVATLGTAGTAFAWHEMIPGIACQVGPYGAPGSSVPPYSYSNGVLLAEAYASSPMYQLAAYCPLTQSAAVVNGSAWYIQANQVVTLNVDVNSDSSDTVYAWACAVNGPYGGSCGTVASTVTGGQQTLHPGLSEWASDNGFSATYVTIFLDYASAINDIFVASY